MRIILIILIFIAILIVLYLSWVPEPRLATTGLIPEWMVLWVDASENDKIRTGIPFIFMGTATGWWVQGKNYPWISWMWAWLGMVAVVFIAETGQMFLPHRSFDWYDIAWGAAGAFSGLAIAVISKYVLKKV